MATLDRRTFLMSSAALAAAGVARAVPPSERIHVAVVGMRGQGGSLLRTFAAQKDVAITHLCDLDPKVLEQRAGELEKAGLGKPKLHKDYRAILEDKEVHAVVLGTPDHWHAIPTVNACAAGKDVYVEKPDGHNILEGRTMVAAARKHERMVQLGTQSRSAPFLKDAARFVADGGIGKAIFAKAWETAKQAPIPRVADSEPPAGVDYDLWLGPAPKRAFNKYRFHGHWRWFFDYGSGDLGNDGVHRLDYARWVLGVTEHPTAVSAAGGKFYFDDAQEWPDTLMVTYEYPGKVLQYEMRIWSEPRLHDQGEGAAIYGDKGWVLVNNSSWKAFDGDGKVIGEGGDKVALGAHARNFLDAVKSRKREDLNQEIAQGHVSSVLCHAGNIAWRTGKKLRFDAKTETFDDAEANKLLGRDYRAGYELPKV
jgi:predicted dehydrogenase